MERRAAQVVDMSALQLSTKEAYVKVGGQEAHLILMRDAMIAVAERRRIAKKSAATLMQGKVAARL